MTESYDGFTCPICEEIRRLKAELSVSEAESRLLRSQLPEGMKHCSIVLNKCDKGHHWLTATNWTKTECPTCARNAERQEKQALADRLNKLTRAIARLQLGEEP